METIDSLARAINNWDGGMVLVSHDFRLISQVRSPAKYFAQGFVCHCPSVPAVPLRGLLTPSQCWHKTSIWGSQ